MAAKKMDWSTVPATELKAILENPTAHPKEVVDAAYQELSARATAMAMRGLGGAAPDPGLAAVVPERPTALTAGQQSFTQGLDENWPDQQRDSLNAHPGPAMHGAGADVTGDLQTLLQRAYPVPGAAAFQRDQSAPDMGPQVPFVDDTLRQGLSPSASGPAAERPSFLPPPMAGTGIPGAPAGGAAPRPGPVSPGRPAPLPGGSGDDQIAAGMATAAEFASPTLAAEQESQNAAEQEMREAAAAAADTDETNKWLALAIGGAKMASTPGGLLQGAAAGLGAGVEAYTAWRQEDLMNRLRQEAADLDREQLGETSRANRAREGMTQAELDATIADRGASRAMDERRLATAEESLRRSGYVQGTMGGRTVWVHPQTGDIKEAPEGFSPATTSSGLDEVARTRLRVGDRIHEIAMAAASSKDIRGIESFDMQKYLDTANALAAGSGAAAPVPAPAGQPAPAAPSGGPVVGAVEGGYRFKGGDPADQKNWEPVR